MPLTHTRAFRVRYYECDLYGHVNMSNYPRCMTEAAFDASTAAGYSPEKYEQIGKTWIIRDTEVEFLKQLRYGDTFEIKTWVTDFRRVRSRRAYEFRLAGEDELIARGHMDWVFINTKTQQPATIPEEMKSAFYPEGPPEEAPRREPFPPPPPPPPGAVTFRKKASWNDVDPTHHVNNAKYFDYFQETNMLVADTYGLSHDFSMDEGIAWFARKVRIEYLQQTRLGDLLDITTFLSDVKRISAVRHYLVQNADTQEMVARAYMYFASIDFSTGRPVRLPADSMAKLAPNIAGEEDA